MTAHSSFSRLRRLACGATLRIGAALASAVLASSCATIGAEPARNAPDAGNANIALAAPTAGATRVASAPAAAHGVGREPALSAMLVARFRIRRASAQRIISAVYQASGDSHIPASLILAVIATESGFNPRARSTVGASGLMQVLPRCHADLIARMKPNQDLFDPEPNIDIGTRILKRYLDDAGGDVTLALQRYSGGTHGYQDRIDGYWRSFAAWPGPADSPLRAPPSMPPPTSPFSA
ncbi:lytic transglycosylase domain-containing protein [Burkholderia sp. L27(2015)]|uniref:lytic transglycosylase domain-containing protein n=1 Tax=Burkholderia sp. L27(2015) TaxID=1641858 RepID=UPI00131D3D9D|nr:transglycosylase SLT domain-containing protein [Burkholderia sp. L27(2015)]